MASVGEPINRPRYTGQRDRSQTVLAAPRDTKGAAICTSRAPGALLWAARASASARNALSYTLGASRHPLLQDAALPSPVGKDAKFRPLAVGMIAPRGPASNPARPRASLRSGGLGGRRPDVEIAAGPDSRASESVPVLQLGDGYAEPGGDDAQCVTGANSIAAGVGAHKR